MYNNFLHLKSHLIVRYNNEMPTMAIVNTGFGA